MAQWSPSKVGGFPLGAMNPAARQILYGSFGWLSSGYGLHNPDKTHGFILFAVLQLPLVILPPLLLCLEKKKKKKKTWCENITLPVIRAHSVLADINHSFMDVSVGLYKTRALLVFLFLIQITQ